MFHSDIGGHYTPYQLLDVGTAWTRVISPHNNLSSYHIVHLGLHASNPPDFLLLFTVLYTVSLQLTSYLLEYKLNPN